MVRKQNTAAPEAKTRKVRVHKNEQRTYIEEEPVVATDAGDVEVVEDSEEDDPIQEFLLSIDDDEDSLTMMVFHLPKWEQDGKIGSSFTDKTYVTTFAFSASDISTYRARVQYAYPQGGPMLFEIRRNGAFFKRWVEKIAPAPGYKPANNNQHAFPFPPPPTITINTPEEKTGAAASPLQMMKDQMSMVKDVIGLAKDLMPAPPVAVVEATNGNNGQSDKPIEERILETVLLKALETDKAPIDKVLDLLSGRREKTGFMDSLAPMLGELMKGLAPAISMGVQQYVRAATAAQGGAPVAPVQEQGQPAQIAAPVAIIDPSERAWRRVVHRMLEDCIEHVRIREASAVDGIQTTPSANAIADLRDRFPEQATLTQMVEMLLNAEPEQVFDMCAMLYAEQPPMAEAVQAMKNMPAATNWLLELQNETKEILAQEEPDGEDANPDL